MTKNLINQLAPPSMADELDLDSLLRRHNATADSTSSSSPSSDNDDDRRRVDDLLNNSDHDSDSNNDNDVVPVRTNSQTLVSTSKSSNSDQVKYNLIQRFKSDEYSGYSSRKPSNSRPASVFGSGYRAAGKPGAALAAAAAASRSIKSRRALSLNLAGKVLDSDGDGVFDVSDQVESVSGEVQGKLTSNGGGDGGSVMDVCETVLECSEGGEDVSRSDSFNEFGNEVEETSLSLVLDDVEGGNEVEEDGTISKFQGVGTSNEVDESEKEKSIFNDSEDVEMSNNVDGSGKETSEFKDTEDVIETSNDVDESENEESMMTMLGNAEKIDGDEHFGIEKDTDLSSGSDVVRDFVAELVEDRTEELQSDSASMEEEKVAKKTPLEVAEELEKKQASTGHDWEEGAAAQPMRLEGARKGSTVLGYFDVNADNAISRAIKSQAFKRDYGRPQVLAVHLNYIALGMSKGVIIVVPSKYSVQHGDRMDSKMLMLGAQGDRSQAPVTSICFDQLGDLLLAGYGDGQIIFWNLPRGTVAKAVPGEHKASAVVHALFLGQDSQANRQYKAVTGDSKGLLLLHEISVSTIFGFQINKTQCLLDGQRTGTVLCASPLLPDQISGGASVSLPGNTTGSTSSLGGVMGGVVGGATGWKLFAEGSSLSEEGVVIFATHQNALVVRLRPSLEVYANFKKPEGVREGAMPYTSWKCTTQSHGSSTENLSQEASEKISLLAIAWDQKVQVAKLVKSKLTFLGNWTLESAAIGLAWLDDQMLVILTLSGQLCLYARDGTLIHQTSYDINGTGGDDMIAYHTYFTNVFGNPEKAYQNSLAVRGASIYVLAPTHLVISRLLLWRERIQVLRDAGDWMGAFNMAMTLYDGQAHGVIDLPRNLDAIQETLSPFLLELLISYVDEVFSYISVAFSNHNVEEEQVDGATSASNSSSSNIKEQFTRVGGVAVEFCVHIKRTDILFDEIFSRFVAVQQRDTFLELLEPYILKDMLGSLPPEVMQALVEHYNCKGWLQRVEQCVLHMDISSLDFNQVVRLCRENGLYGALIYLFNKGLDDFKTPLEELLSVLKNHESDSAAVGYRMLVYLKYCFSGIAFPPGHGTISRQRLQSLRSELVHFLLEDFGRPKSQSGASVSFSGAYLNLYYLLELDTEATLDVLRIAFVEDDNFEPDVVVDDPTMSDRVPENKNIMVQKTVDGLVLVLDVNISQTIRSAGNNDTSMGLWPSKKDIGQIIEFIASYIATKRAFVSKSVMSQILEYLMSENYVFLSSSEQMNESKKRREKKVLALLDAVPPTEWNASFVLHLSEKAQFYQVCGLIHATRCDYLAALDSYMKDVDEPVYAISFIDGMLLKLSETDSIAFRSAVISRIPELVILSREGTYFLVRSYFNKESSRILSELQSNPGSLFLYLKTLFEVHLSGTLNFSSIYVDNVLDCPWGKQKKSDKSCLKAYLERVYEFPKFIRDNPVEVSDDIIELYLEMLCKYEPDSVLKFLETSESYRVDRCLQLCQEYRIVDAAAFLLERVGDVGSALLLVLSDLNDKFMMLDTAVGNLIPSKDEDKNGHIDHLPAASRLEEVQDVERILRACIGLCQRNTPRLESDEAESLWFHMLDTFCKPLLISQGNSEIGMFAQSSSFKKVSEADEITWRICGSQRYAPLLKRLFSQFIKEIVEGMIGYVRLPSIMSKLLTDNGGQEFGDFKPTILGMLGTYSFEMRILDTAKCLIEDDTFYTMSALRKGASKGYAPRSLLCCLCNTSFSKSSSSSGIRMFSCGHAIHLQCELQESGTSSQRSSHVCPVCVIKKRSHKAKGKVVEQGLVSTSSYRSWRPQGAASHPHELDAFENLTSSHPISRFEMLNSLQTKKSTTQTDTMPQLRLAPPAVYHDKVNKRSHFPGGSSEASEKQSKNRQLRDLKAKGSSIRFPLKSKIFGKEKTRV